MDALPSNRLRTEQLAHWIWLQRGKPEGSGDDNWFLAEALLERQDQQVGRSLEERPLFAFGIERRTI